MKYSVAPIPEDIENAEPTIGTLKRIVDIIRDMALGRLYINSINYCSCGKMKLRMI